MKLTLAFVLAAGACAPPLQPIPRVDPHTPELPPLVVEQVSVGPMSPDSRAAAADGPRVTLHASQADVRVLIPALAEIAGVSVVMDPTVRGTVDVRFEEIPAMDALRTVIESAGLGIMTGPASPWAESHFRQFPVNVNSAGAVEISGQFGVSQKLAEWIVLERNWPPPARN